MRRAQRRDAKRPLTWSLPSDETGNEIVVSCREKIGGPQHPAPTLRYLRMLFVFLSFLFTMRPRHRRRRSRGMKQEQSKLRRVPEWVNGLARTLREIWPWHLLAMAPRGWMGFVEPACVLALGGVSFGLRQSNASILAARSDRDGRRRIGGKWRRQSKATTRRRCPPRSRCRARSRPRCASPVATSRPVARRSRRAACVGSPPPGLA